MPQATDLIHRTQQIVGIRPEWFRTALRWYENVNLTRRVIEDMLREDVREFVSIAVNDRHLANLPGEAQRLPDKMSWVLPSNLLNWGDNDIVVSLDRQANSPLGVSAAAAGQEEKLPLQTLDLSRHPPPTVERLELGLTGSAHHQDRCWQIQPGGFLLFKLRLDDIAPVQFNLRISSSDPTLARDLLKRTAKEAIEAVKQRRRELQEKRRQILEQGGRPSERLENDLHALSAYKRLHELQLEPALGDPEVSLRQVIAQSGDPNQIVIETELEPIPKRSRGGTCGCGAVLAVLLVVSLVGLVLWQIDDVRRPVQNWWGSLFPQRLRNVDANLDRVLADRGARGGEVQISLYWANKNDLDLHVVCPSGERIWFGNVRSKCGGRLDVDMNRGYANAKAQAAENVFWPQGKAPRGRYQVFVDHYSTHSGSPGCPDRSPFALRIIVRGRRQVFHGEVVHSGRRKALVHQFTLK